MGTNAKQNTYHERVIPGLAYFVAGSVIPFISTLIALPFIDEWLWLVPLITYGGYVYLGIALAPRIEISAETLTVGNASIPRSFITSATEIKDDQLFAERSSNLNARAFIRFQVGVKGLVKIEISDPADPTPYWLFATRNADLVTAYLNRTN